jgi:hypothetical protein
MQQSQFLPRSTWKRCVLGLLSLPLLALSAPLAACAVVLLACHILGPIWPAFRPAADPDGLVRAFLAVFMEFGLGVFVMALLGFLWAVWTPAWVERGAERAARHVCLVALLLMVLLGVLFLLA